MGRSPCCEKVGLKKGPWTPEEDQRLLAYIEEQGHGCWRELPTKAGLQRCGKSCRLRWTNYLRPDIKRGTFSVQEEQTIIQLHALLGNRWSAIASHLPKRTDNEIKNFWNTHLKKRLAKMGIDPVTHKPRCDVLSHADSHASTKAAANVSHMAQWESARLEAEARLARESKLLRFASSISLPATDASGSSSSSSSAAAPLFQMAPPGSVASSLPVELHGTTSQASSAPALPPSSDVLRAWQGVWSNSTKGSGDARNSRDRRIDLESPTSTLSFTESVLPLGPAGFVDHHYFSSERGRCTEGPGDGSGPGDDDGKGEEMEGEVVDWRCFPKPMQLFDTREKTETFSAETFPVDSSLVSGADVSSWLHDSLRTGPGTAVASAGEHFGDGFTEMLLHNSDEHNLSESGSGCATELAASTREGNGVIEGQNKSYWNRILNLVDSASPSNSPDCVLV